MKQGVLTPGRVRLLLQRGLYMLPVSLFFFSCSMKVIDENFFGQEPLASVDMAEGMVRGEGSLFVDALLVQISLF